MIYLVSLHDEEVQNGRTVLGYVTDLASLGKIKEDPFLKFLKIEVGEFQNLYEEVYIAKTSREDAEIWVEPVHEID